MNITRINQQAATLQLVQFTDPHLFANRAGEMRGVNTYQSLQNVLLAARNKNWTPDALLVTGDIAQDESREGYRVFREIFEPLQLPVLCLPGNHDNPEFMREELDGNFIILQPVQFDHWCVLQLNTFVSGTACGELSEEELVGLDQVLQASKKLHCLVCLHHQPVPVGSKWLDGVGLRNATSFFDVLDKHDNVRGVLWGHVHQQYDGERNGVRLMGSPSTCRQFLPDSDNFALDDAPPGYRWLQLGAKGELDTGVEYESA